MIFEAGKYYQHASGHLLHTLAVVETTCYGQCLIAEDHLGNFIAVGETPEHATNYIEISKEDWDKHFAPMILEEVH